jgi:hypothetical protein
MLVLLIGSGVFGCREPEAESYYIQKGFQGRINIIFNQSKGDSFKYENGRRVYQIPSNGILLTQFKDEYGIVDHQYYYVDGIGNKKALKIFSYDYNKDGTTKWIVKDRNEVGVFLDGTTGGYGRSNIRYQEFIVSDYNSLDSFYLPKYQYSFMKEIQSALKDDFHADTLTIK